jgi:hypothetical protein
VLAQRPADLVGDCPDLHRCHNSRPSGFWTAKGRRPSAPQVRDAQLLALIRGVHAGNYGVYGARRLT